jgi:paired amphipathic helix protein Sin3a
MAQKERWEYYVSSFIRIEPTEGVPRHLLKHSVLARNMPSSSDSSSSSAANDNALPSKPLPAHYAENLSMRICVNTYDIHFDPNSYEYFVYTKTSPASPGENDRKAALHEKRREKFKEKFDFNAKWKRDLGTEAVGRVNRDFEMWVRDGVEPGSAVAGVVPEAQVLAIEEGHVADDMEE